MHAYYIIHYSDLFLTFQEIVYFKNIYKYYFIRYKYQHQYEIDVNICTLTNLLFDLKYIFIIFNLLLIIIVL